MILTQHSAPKKRSLRSGRPLEGRLVSYVLEFNIDGHEPSGLGYTQWLQRLHGYSGYNSYNGYTDYMVTMATTVTMVTLITWLQRLQQLQWLH